MLVVSKRRHASLYATASVMTVAVLVLCCYFRVTAAAHGFGSAITWNREISRIVYARCASCHRPDGSSFSLMTYAEAQPRANEIKEAVLSRRMPPWGAIKGFGDFRNDESLTPEQIELITKWVDGGIRRGNNPRLLPKPPSFETGSQPPPRQVIRVSGAFKLPQGIVIDGLQPEHVPVDGSMRVVAVLPSGSVEPLVWLHQYNDRFSHAFLFRRPRYLPAGTVIQGVAAGASLALLPAQ
jgi:hypothetical protein